MDPKDNYRPNWLSTFYQSVANAVSAIARDARVFAIPQTSGAIQQVVEWLRRNYLWIAIFLGGVIYLGLWIYITWELPFRAVALLDRLEAEINDEFGTTDTINNLIVAFGALLGALALLATIPFQLIKTWMNERNAQTAEAGHITDRINKAVDQLGAEKTVTYRARYIHWTRMVDGHEVREGFSQRWGEGPDIQNKLPPELAEMPKEAQEPYLTFGEWEAVTETVPNLEVRLGGIYALERIAQDSLRDHIQVMEILCAYIRNNAPASEAERNPLPPWPDWPENADGAAMEARDK
ncbi:MAG: hypothetical protein AAF503_14460 [Pseudomonadota bacterium]